MKYFTLCIFLKSAFFFTAFGKSSIFMNISMRESLPEKCGQTRLDNTKLIIHKINIAHAKAKFEDTTTFLTQAGNQSEIGRERSNSGRQINEADGDTTQMDASIQIEATVGSMQNGQAQPGQFPWVTRLGFANDSFSCSGSLISRYYVFTSARCKDTGDIVRIGDTYTAVSIDCDEFDVCAPPYQDIKVKSFLVQDGCGISESCDAMLIELEKPAEFNDFVQPICVPDEPLSNEDLVHETIIILTWDTAASSSGLSTASNLTYNVVTVGHTEDCKSKHLPLRTKNHICFLGLNLTSADFGSPIMMTKKAKGKTSSIATGFLISSLLVGVKENEKSKT